MKKAMNLILLVILLVSAFSASADAAIFENIFDSIEDFLDDGWKDSQKIVTFVVLFFLFFSAYLIGMKKAFKEVTRAHIVFAFTAAFLSAFIITTTIEIDAEILKWIGIALLAIILLFGIFVALIKMGMENHKIWAFIIALLLTALIIGLILLFVLGDGLDTLKDFFGDVGSLDGKIGGGGKKDLCSRFNGMEFNCNTMSGQGCVWNAENQRCTLGGEGGKEFEGKQELTEEEKKALEAAAQQPQQQPQQQEGMNIGSIIMLIVIILVIMGGGWFAYSKIKDRNTPSVSNSATASARTSTPGPPPSRGSNP